METFPKQYELTGISVGEKDLFANPTSIIHSGSYYIVYDHQGAYCYYLLNEKFETIFPFAKRGEGPRLVVGEPMIFRQNFIENSGLFDYKFDRSIHKWHIDFSTNTPRLALDTIQTLNIPENLYNIQYLGMINPSKFVGMGGMAEGKLYIFNPNGKDTAIITPFVPLLDATISKNDKMFKYNRPYVGKRFTFIRARTS